MKEICCIDCEHCHDYLEVYDSIVTVRYTCDAGSVIKEVEDPEKIINCDDFVQFIDDL